MYVSASVSKSIFLRFFYFTFLVPLLWTGQTITRSFKPSNYRACQLVNWCTSSCRDFFTVLQVLRIVAFCSEMYVVFFKSGITLVVKITIGTMYNFYYCYYFFTFKSWLKCRRTIWLQLCCKIRIMALKPFLKLSKKL